MLYAVNPPCLQRADGTANVCVDCLLTLYEGASVNTGALFFCCMPLIPLVYSGPTVLQTFGLTSKVWGGLRKKFSQSKEENGILSVKAQKVEM